jgi:hypothetical protein
MLRGDVDPLLEPLTNRDDKAAHKAAKKEAAAGKDILLAPTR